MDPSSCVCTSSGAEFTALFFLTGTRRYSDARLSDDGRRDRQHLLIELYSGLPARRRRAVVLDPHAHALANVKEPHDQAVVAMIGAFVEPVRQDQFRMAVRQKVPHYL